MARKFLTALDLSQNELQNAAIQRLGSDPGSPVKGQVWLNTTDKNLKFVDEDGVVRVLLRTGGMTNADIATGAAIALSKLATDPLARANHTGTQTASTISDFDTQVRTSRLDQMAAPTADVSINSHKLTNVTDPAAAQDAATKGYVDALASGQDWKASVRAATTAAGTLASSFENGDTIDGVALATGDRILIKNQASASENGIYTVNASGAPTRATDADSSAEVTPGMTVPVEEGTTNGDTIWLLTTNATITLGTTGLSFTQLPGAGYTAGTGLSLSGNQFSLQTPVSVANGGTNATTAAAARTSLGATTKYSADITGDGSAVNFTVNHALGTKDIVVAVYEVTTDDEVICDVHRTDTNNVRIGFAVAPANSKVYRVVVIA